MKTALLVTFDFTQRGKSGTGLAAGFLLSACRAHESYGRLFTIEHLPIKMPDTKILGFCERDQLVREALYDIHSEVELKDLQCLVLACYIWSSDLIEPLIARCRGAGFSGKVIVGGYQVHPATCERLYPSADTYIVGDGEVALPKAILADTPLIDLLTSPIISSTGNVSSAGNILRESVDFEALPSPYLDGSLAVDVGQSMVHWETRRGCAFKCSFCAHRDLGSGKVHVMGRDKIFRELDYFHAKQVQKINVLDPIFNRESDHLDILRYVIKVGLTSLLSLQVRFELVTEEFLELCSQLNVHLEFGLQTAIESESIAVERKNNMRAVDKSIRLIQSFNQTFEVSLIYGLPEQTLRSFKASVEYLKVRGVSEIKAFPLMLLEGTDLHINQEKYGIKEDYIDGSGIPHVVESDSFSRQEWQQMHAYAQQLMKPMIEPINNKEAA